MGLLSTIGAASARAYGFTRSAIAAAVDAYFNRVTLLLPGNGTNGAQNNTFLDSSSNNFTITRNGNTTQGTFSPFSQTGWSNYFNGSTDYLLPASGSDFTLGTGDFSISVWIYPTASATATTGFFGIGGAATGSFQIFTKFPTGGNDTLVINSTNNTTVVTTGVLNVNAWNHIAIARASGTMSVYLNGTRVANTSFSHNLSLTEPVIGRTYHNLSQEYFAGYISDLRVVKGTSLYSGTTITVPTAFSTDVTNTKLLTCQSNRFVDVNTQVAAKTITVNGNTSVQAFSPFAPTAAYSAATNGGSGYFDGTGDYLSIANNAAFNFGTGDFTVEFWFYALALAADSRFISNAAFNGSGIDISWESGSSRITWYIGGTAYTIPLPSRYAWHHVAFTRSGTTFNTYINGARANTYTLSTNITSANNLIIGAYHTASNPTNAYIADLRLLKGTAQYTGTTYTVPTEPLTAITNTSLLLNFTNAGIIDATGKNVLETVGNAQISTTQSKWGGGSMYFDGTGDYLTLPTSKIIELGSNDFTLEGWLYLPNVTTQQSVCYLNGNSSGYAGVNLQVQSGAFNVWLSTSGGGWAVQQNTVGSISANTWTYFALVRSGTNVKLYVNGTNVSGAGYTLTGSLMTAYTLNQIGAYNTASYQINGYIDDLRLTFAARTISASPTASFPVQ